MTRPDQDSDEASLVSADPRYSPVWFSTFLHSIDPLQTLREVAFIERQLPLPHFARVLDLCCGPGRHAIPLSTRGYEITGVDFDAAAIGEARAARATATFIHDDVRNISNLGGQWDAALIMWASFGYFTPSANQSLLESIHARLRPAGRLILDIYNRDFFLTRQGAREGERAGVSFTETKHVEGDRLHVELDYESRDVRDAFSWQVFDAHSIAGLLNKVGFHVIGLYTGFDEVRDVTPDDARMQVVAEKNAGNVDSSSDPA
jgi:SAM-dependent methyltransferase